MLEAGVLLKGPLQGAVRLSNQANVCVELWEESEAPGGANSI